MNSQIVYYSYVRKQEIDLNRESNLSVAMDYILCPMCEYWHENNSNCQRND
jgi:hypothetical protein